jgi:hypothetical protein
VLTADGKTIPAVAVPMKVRVWDLELQAYHQRVIGYRACSDIEKVGPLRPTVREAREDAAAWNAQAFPEAV